MSAEAVTPSWEDWRRLGFWTALWQTWRDSTFRPIAFFRALPPAGPKGAPLTYFTLVAAFGLFFRLYWVAVERLLNGGQGLGNGALGVELNDGGAATVLLAGTFVAFVFLVAVYVALLVLTAAIVHVGFAAAGAGRQGFDGTFRALAYSAGPLAFWVFPFFGPLLAIVWITVVMFIAMREVQRTTNGRATLGFLIPSLGLLLLFVLAAAALLLIISTADVGGGL